MGFLEGAQARDQIVRTRQLVQDRRDQAAFQRVQGEYEQAINATPELVEFNTTRRQYEEAHSAYRYGRIDPVAMGEIEARYITAQANALQAQEKALAQILTTNPDNPHIAKWAGGHLQTGAKTAARLSGAVADATGALAPPQRHPDVEAQRAAEDRGEVGWAGVNEFGDPEVNTFGDAPAKPGPEATPEDRAEYDRQVRIRAGRTQMMGEAEKLAEGRLTKANGGMTSYQAAQLDNADRRFARQEERDDVRDSEREQQLMTSEGKARDPEAAKAYRKFKQNSEQFHTAIEAMRLLREQNKGATVLDRAAVAKGKQLAAEAQIAWKNMAGLGVLSASDIAMMDAVIPSNPLGVGFGYEEKFKQMLERIKAADQAARKEYLSTPTPKTEPKTQAPPKFTPDQIKAEIERRKQGKK